LVRKAGDPLGEMAQQSTVTSRASTRCIDDSPMIFDIELARPIGDDFDDLVIVEPLAERPEAPRSERPFGRRR